MKPIIQDSRVTYVYYIEGTNDIFGTWTQLNKPLASILDVEKHHEIWDCPLVVLEGECCYENGEYILTAKSTKANQPNLVAKRTELTLKEQEMMDAMIKIWDLMDYVPGCNAKHEIIQIAGSIIYADN